MPSPKICRLRQTTPLHLLHPLMRTGPGVSNSHPYTKQIFFANPKCEDRSLIQTDEKQENTFFGLLLGDVYFFTNALEIKYHGPVDRGLYFT